MKDLIERQAAIDTMCRHLPYVSQKRAEIILREVPSAQPEHSEGLYVDGYNDGYRDGMNDAPEIIRCKDCKHKPTTTPDYNADNGDCGYEIEFPDYRCPCQCDDGWYNRLPEDDWFCGNAERKDNETD